MPTCYPVEKVQPEEHELFESVVEAQQVLPPALGTDVDFQGADGVGRFPAGFGADVLQLHGLMLPHGGEQLQQDLAAQSVEHIVVLEAETRGQGFQLVQKGGTDDTQRVRLRKEGKGVCPGVQRQSVLASAVEQLPALLSALQKAQSHIFLQLFADGGDIRLPVRLKGAEVFLREQIRDLPGGAGVSVLEKIQNVEMKGHIAGGEAPGLEGVVERIAPDGTAVHGEKHMFSLRGQPETHTVSQPAFYPAAFVIIAAGAFGVVFRPALEAIDIELPHIIPDPVKIFDKLAVSHAYPPKRRQLPTLF